MILPKALQEEGFKPSETCSQVFKCGSSYPLVEYGVTENGNEIECYLAVSPGDTLSVKYWLRSSQVEYVDVLVDGILRWSNYNKNGTMKHSRQITQVCLCNWKKSGAKGKLQLFDMVVKELTAGYYTSKSALDDRPQSTSTVGTIEVKILRQIPPGGKQVQPARGPTFENHENWWSASAIAGSVALDIPPTYEISFSNPSNTSSNLRKYINDNIKGFYEWTSFKFHFRSASDLRAAGFAVPIAVPSTTESSASKSCNNTDNDMNLTAEVVQPMESFKSEAVNLELVKDIAPSEIKSEIQVSESEITETSSTLMSKKSEEPAGQVSPLIMNRHDVGDIADVYRIGYPMAELAGFNHMQREEEAVVVENPETHGEKVQEPVVGMDLSGPSKIILSQTSITAAFIPPAAALSVICAPRIKGLGINLKALRASHVSCDSSVDTDGGGEEDEGGDEDEDVIQSRLHSELAPGLALSDSAGRNESLPNLEESETSGFNISQTGLQTIVPKASSPAHKTSSQPVQLITNHIRGCAFISVPAGGSQDGSLSGTVQRVSKNLGGGFLAAISNAVIQPSPANTPRSETSGPSSLQSTMPNTPHDLEIQREGSVELGSRYITAQSDLSSPNITPTRIDWGSKSQDSQQTLYAANFYLGNKSSTTLNEHSDVKNVAPLTSKSFRTSSPGLGQSAISPPFDMSLVSEEYRFPTSCKSRSLQMDNMHNSRECPKYSEPELGVVLCGLTQDVQHKVTNAENASSELKKHKRKYSKDDLFKDGYLKEAPKKKRYNAKDCEIDSQMSEKTPAQFDKDKNQHFSAFSTLSSSTFPYTSQIEARISPSIQKQKRLRKLQEHKDALARAQAEIKELDRRIKEAEAEAEIEEAEVRKVEKELEEARKMIVAQQARLREFSD